MLNPEANLFAGDPVGNGGDSDKNGEKIILKILQMIGGEMKKIGALDYYHQLFLKILKFIS